MCIHAVIIQILKTGAMRARHQTTNLSISDAAVTSSEPQSACVKVGTHSGFFFFFYLQVYEITASASCRFCSPLFLV